MSTLKKGINDNMNIAISSDSSLDLTKELEEKYDIHVVPFAIIMGEEQYYDGEVTSKEIFAYTESTGKLARTSAVNEAQSEDHFRSLLKKYDAVIHFTISSDMSASYQNALKASEKFKNVYVVDSRTLSTGVALQAIYAKKLADSGLDPETIVAKVKERIPFDQASFAIEAVNYLYKGGRCSGLAALGANILRIRPQIVVKEGKMLQGKKFRGPMNKWVKDYVEETLKEYDNPDHSIIFITYSSATDEAVNWCIDRLKKEGFKNIYSTNAGGTVSCHCGPMTLGILYFNDGDHE